MRKLIVVFLVFLCPLIALADVSIVPPDVTVVIRLVEARVKPLADITKAAKVVVKDQRVYFFNESMQEEAYVTFREDTPGIVKYIKFKQSEDDTYEAVLSLKEPATFNRIVTTVHGQDALVFYNAQDVIVYTQAEDNQGKLTLQEWIWALRPNVATGSRYAWEVVAGMWQWPVTMDMNTEYTVSINRNVPLKGVPYALKARYDYMLNLMVHHMDENLRKFFPFQESIASIEVPFATNREGIKKRVEVKVSNLENADPAHVKPKTGLDFKGWQNRWTSLYEIKIPAKSDEYPLLIKK